MGLKLGSGNLAVSFPLAETQQAHDFDYDNTESIYSSSHVFQEDPNLYKKIFQKRPE